MPHQVHERTIVDEHTNKLRVKLMEDEQTIFEVFNSRSESQLEAEEKEGYLVDLSGLNLRGIDLHQAKFVNMDLSDTDMSDSSLWGSTFRRSKFRNTIMNGAELGGSVFIVPKNQQNNMVNVPLRFVEANLFDVTLDNANLADAQLKNAQLENASLQNAHLAGAIVTGANFEGANISGARFTEKPARLQHCTIGLTQKQLDQALQNVAKAPFLDGVLDTETNEPLVWSGKGRSKA